MFGYFGHAGAIFAIDWAVIGDLGADVGPSWWQAGARERQEDDQEGHMEPAWGARRLPDGKYPLGWRVIVPFWGPTSLLNTISKTLSLQEVSIDSKTLSLNFEDSS